MKKGKKGFFSITFVFTVCAAFCVFTACTPPVSNLPSPLASSSASSPSSPYDPDLGSWRTASWTPFTVNDPITGFAWGLGGAGEVCVAVSSSGVIGYSRDGDIWEAAKPASKVNQGDPDPYDPAANGIHFNAVAFGGGTFVAVGNAGRIAYSNDGIRWTAGPSGGITGFGTTNIYGIAWGTPGAGSGSVFVAVGANANIACSSDGGLNWTGGTVGVFSNIQLNDVCFGNGVFYVVGNGGHRAWSDNPASTSSWQHYESKPRNTDSTWANEKDDLGYPFFGNNLTKVTYGMYGGDPGIAVVFDEWGGRRIAIATHDNFKRNAWDADLDSGYFGNNTIRGIAYGGGNFVAAGTSSMIGFWPSANPGNNNDRYWRVLPFYQFRYWEITALAALNGRFYAGNIGGKIGYSK
ncbi:MAG: hypothetical protein LBF63_11730 [Treponema sp.]|jgi:hypothetical protein|nr:hypothetical protein [Treponema sp.]